MVKRSTIFRLRYLWVCSNGCTWPCELNLHPPTSLATEIVRILLSQSVGSGPYKELANKWWECEAMLTAMLNANAFPPALSDGTISSPWCDAGSLSSPRSQTTDASNPILRAIFSHRQGKTIEGQKHTNLQR